MLQPTAPELRPCLTSIRYKPHGQGLNPNAKEFVPSVAASIGGTATASHRSVSTSGAGRGDKARTMLPIMLQSVRLQERLAAEIIQRTWRNHKNERSMLAQGFPDMFATSGFSKDLGMIAHRGTGREEIASETYPLQKHVLLFAQEHVGVISAWDEARGCGEIESASMRQLTGSTVLLDTIDTIDVRTGDTVRFRVGFFGADRAVRARDVKLLPSVALFAPGTADRCAEHASNFNVGNASPTCRQRRSKSEGPPRQRRGAALAEGNFELHRTLSVDQEEMITELDAVRGRHVFHDSTMTNCVASRVHEGTIVDFDEAHGFGFLQSPEISRLIGRTLFFRGSDFSASKRAGGKLQFLLEQDHDGRLYARDPAARAVVQRKFEQPLTMEELLNNEHTGIVHEWHNDRGFGFVTNTSIHSLCGHDVFFLRGQLGDAGEVIGSRVRFHVELDHLRRPRVTSAAGEASAIVVPRAMTLEECLNQVHEGYICDYDAARGRGFIRHSRIHKLFGKDVLFHGEQVASKTIGDIVHFRVELDLDGRPRVRDALPHDVQEVQNLTQAVPAADKSQRPCVGLREVTCFKSGLGDAGFNSHGVAQVFEGTILHYDPSNGCGMIQSSPVQHKLKRNTVAILSTFGALHRAGDEVAFRVEFATDGTACAKDIQNSRYSRSGDQIEEPLTMEGLLSREHEGLIAEVDRSRGFGFIRNQSVQKLCGKDVFFKCIEFPGCSIGDAVTFSVALDGMGRPRTRAAQDQAISGHIGEASAVLSRNVDDAGKKLNSLDDLLKGEHVGVVKEQNFEKGYGFVTSPAIVQLLGKDVFFRRADFDPKVANGSVVRFCVELDREGRPKARDPSRVAADAAGSGSNSVNVVETEEICTHTRGESATLTEKDMLELEHTGIILDYSHARGHGFVHNKGIRQLTGHDVLIHKGQFWNRQIGDALAFKVALSSEGHARAVSVRGVANEGDGYTAGATCIPHVFKLLAPDNLVAAVIGRGGKGIADFWNDTQTRVHITPRGDCHFGSTFRVLTMLSSTCDSLLAALSQVLMILTACIGGLQGNENPADVSTHLLLRVVLPMFTISRLMFADASEIQAIQRKSLCNMTLEREHVGFGAFEEGVALLSGTSAAVKAAISLLLEHVRAACQESWFCEWFARTNTPADVLAAWDNTRASDINEATTKVMTWDDLTSKEHVGVIGRGSAFHAFIENSDVRKLTGYNVYVPKSQLWGRRYGDSVKFQVQLDTDGRPRAVGMRPLADHVAGEFEKHEIDASRGNARDSNVEAHVWAPGEVEVNLGEDFGPMGLRFRAGVLPEIEAIRDESQDFWMKEHGLRVGDRLLRISGQCAENLKSTDILQELARRPLKLAFVQAESGITEREQAAQEMFEDAQPSQAQKWPWKASWGSYTWYPTTWYARNWEGNSWSYAYDDRYSASYGSRAAGYGTRELEQSAESDHLAPASRVDDVPLLVDQSERANLQGIAAAWHVRTWKRNSWSYASDDRYAASYGPQKRAHYVELDSHMEQENAAVVSAADDMDPLVGKLETADLETSDAPEHVRNEEGNVWSCISDDQSAASYGSREWARYETQCPHQPVEQENSPAVSAADDMEPLVGKLETADLETSDSPEHVRNEEGNVRSCISDDQSAASYGSREGARYETQCLHQPVEQENSLAVSVAGDVAPLGDQLERTDFQGNGVPWHGRKWEGNSWYSSSYGSQEWVHCGIQELDTFKEHESEIELSARDAAPSADQELDTFKEHESEIELSARDAAPSADQLQYVNLEGTSSSHIEDYEETGEENEEEIYAHFSKLYHFVDNEWKEKGIGEAKLLNHKKTGKVRFLLRQEKTMKVLCNHLVVDVNPYCELLGSAGGDTCWVWTAQDFADDEMQLVKLALKFNSPDEARAFKEVFESVKQWIKQEAWWTSDEAGLPEAVSKNIEKVAPTTGDQLEDAELQSHEHRPVATAWNARNWAENSWSHSPDDWYSAPYWSQQRAQCWSQEFDHRTKQENEDALSATGDVPPIVDQLHCAGTEGVASCLFDAFGTGIAEDTTSADNTWEDNWQLGTEANLHDTVASDKEDVAAVEDTWEDNWQPGTEANSLDAVASDKEDVAAVEDTWEDKWQTGNEANLHDAVTSDKEDVVAVDDTWEDTLLSGDEANF